MTQLHLPYSITKVLRFIEDNYSERIALDQLAEVAGMSKFHFSRFFSLHTGMPPIKHLTAVRIRKAKELLMGTSFTVSHVAELTGYNDVVTFSRQYKHVTGIPPSQGREL